MLRLRTSNNNSILIFTSSDGLCLRSIPSSPVSGVVRFATVRCVKGPSRSVQICRSTGPSERSRSNSDPWKKGAGWGRRQEEEETQTLGTFSLMHSERNDLMHQIKSHSCRPLILKARLTETVYLWLPVSKYIILFVKRLSSFVFMYSSQLGQRSLTLNHWKEWNNCNLKVCTSS